MFTTYNNIQLPNIYIYIYTTTWFCALLWPDITERTNYSSASEEVARFYVVVSGRLVNLVEEVELHRTFYRTASSRPVFWTVATPVTNCANLVKVRANFRLSFTWPSRASAHRQKMTEAKDAIYCSRFAGFCDMTFSQKVNIAIQAVSLPIDLITAGSERSTPTVVTWRRRRWWFSNDEQTPGSDAPLKKRLLKWLIF